MIGVPVLSIAGSDPSGGAGIQADLKAIGACGGYGMSVITALTAQNTRGVSGVHVPPAEFLQAQLRSVLSDVPPAAIKIGMLGSVEVIETVAQELDALHAAGALPPVVLDPVMIATSGDRLLDEAGEHALSSLFALVDIVTPNAPELGALLGEPTAETTEELGAQARELATRHGLWVLAKGGHLPASGTGELTDLLVSPAGEAAVFTHPFIETSSTHGTGCTLSSALATLAARGLGWAEATREAIGYLSQALQGAQRLAIGSGHGPVNHLGALWAAGARAGGVPGLGVASATWAALAPRAEATYSTTVVAGLALGDVGADLMQHYLGQDLAYLDDYAQRLSDAGALAAARGEESDAAFWDASALACREEEPMLHVKLGASVPAPDEVTAAYAEHLAAARAEGYEVLAAALLPCFVLYAEVGARLARTTLAGEVGGAGAAGDTGAGERDGDAPTSGTPAVSPAAREWIESYADADFAASAADAMARVDAIGAGATEAVRERMAWAIAESLEREIAFFDR